MARAETRLKKPVQAFDTVILEMTKEEALGLLRWIEKVPFIIPGPVHRELIRVLRPDTDTDDGWAW